MLHNILAQKSTNHCLIIQEERMQVAQDLVAYIHIDNQALVLVKHNLGIELDLHYGK